MRYTLAAAALLPALTLAHPGTGNQIPLGADIAPERHAHHHTPQNPISAVVDSVAEHLQLLPAATRELWDEVENMLPKKLDQMSIKSSPKKHTKRPDEHWDFHVPGKKFGVLGGEGKFEGDLDQYRLRGKKVDPAKLGVDPGVKQYSGYLDDDENDKHLFYCTYTPPI